MAVVICNDNLQEILILRNAVCKILPKSRIRKRLMDLDNRRSLEILGVDVLQIAQLKPESFVMWQFSAQVGVFMEHSNLVLCRNILTKAFEMVDPAICFSGYLHVLARFVNLCVPDAWTGEAPTVTTKYITILEDAHKQWLAYDVTESDMENGQSLFCGLADNTIQKYLILLHTMMGNYEQSIDHGEDWYETTELIRNSQIGIRGEMHMLSTQTMGLPLLIDSYENIKKFEQAIETCDKLLSTWENLYESKVQHPAQSMTINNIIAGRDSARILKGELILHSGFSEKAFRFLMSYGPPNSLFNNNSFSMDYNIVGKWCKLVEECVEELVKSSPHKCAMCNKPSTKRCTGCFTVYYCSKICQKKDRKLHGPSCDYTPARKFTKLFTDVVDAMYSHDYYCIAIGQPAGYNIIDNEDVEYIKLFGGISMAVFKSDSDEDIAVFLRCALKCTNRLLQKHYIDLAGPFLMSFSALTVMGQYSNIFPAYFDILKHNWKKAVMFCKDYASHYKATHKAKYSLLPFFFEAVALYNLGYTKIAQRSINIFVSEIRHQIELAPDQLAPSDGQRKTANHLGETIDQLWSFILQPENVLLDKCFVRCFYCEIKYSDAKKMSKCQECGDAKYCGKECQDKDWEFHRLLCDKASGPDILISKPGQPMPRMFRNMKQCELKFQRSQDAFIEEVDCSLLDLKLSTSNSQSKKCAGIGCEKQECTHKCSQCKLTRYCSRPCQVSHWKNGHKEQCKLAKDRIEVVQ